MSKITSAQSHFYAENLKFLWEQYNKLLGLGIIASAATLGFLLQGIVLNKDVRDVLSTSTAPINTNLLATAIVCAGLAALCFIIARWCSQVLMERQIYGKFSEAEAYFKETLKDETIWPTALQPKPYMSFIERKTLLRTLGTGNEIAKWLGISLILTSWSLSVIFSWPLISF